ncbi:MAG: precorrin-6y C5,15-methyltransferase (decarboxylating) subunit CbiE [Firmicutes bacterium]|nr:precorrin-6y C5,15-methyltransferase (decarboxylating) subunit CbiE [Bacillota bacterium]
MVTVVGIGPGHPDFITPAAVKCIKDADVLIGGKRALEAVEKAGKQTYLVTADIDDTLSAISDNRDREVAVLVSGDPGFYSLLKAIKKGLPELPIKVIPGISSVQMLFSAIAQEWQDVQLISVHGRPINELDSLIKRTNKICILTDEKLTADKVCRYLQSSGFNGRAVVGRNLSYPDQEVIDKTIEEIAAMQSLGSSVLYVEVI